MFICHTYGAHVKELITHLESCHIKSRRTEYFCQIWDRLIAALQAIEFERVHDIWRRCDVDHLIVLPYVLLLYGC